MTEIKSTWATLIWSTNSQLNTEIYTMQNALFSASETTKLVVMLLSLPLYKYCGCSTLRSLLDGFGVRVIYNLVLKFRSQRFVTLWKEVNEIVVFPKKKVNEMVLVGY
uniref:uncharacterized protein LOC122599845 n=1 Tax=Erigeron canadensis TaxID=72917 RepID=UPI001CB89DB1|nr:uncharacterized protein LOC122599845 [Erigeron canadensis]